MSLSPTMSAALLGLACLPGPFGERFTELCENTLDLVRAPEQIVRLTSSVEGEVPRSVRDTILRAAHELVQNAVLHGMHLRLLGTIRVELNTAVNGAGAKSRLQRTLLLEVADDGWGCGPSPVFGRGLRTLGILAEHHGGALRLERADGWTRARLVLPHHRHAP